VTKRMQLAILFLGIIGLVTGTILIGAYQAARQVPQFYREAMKQQPTSQQVAGEQLEKQVLDLHNDAQREGQWEAVFTDQQVNGWLATDLVQEFPRLLPHKMRDPRVAIDENRVRLACRYQHDNSQSVVWVDVDMYLTDEPNVVAVRVCRARAGMLPIPLKYILDSITSAARRAEIKMKWAHDNGDPVAMFTIPAQREADQRVIHLDALELRKGEVRVAGRTESPDDDDVEDLPETPHVGQSEEIDKSQQ